MPATDVKVRFNASVDDWRTFTRQALDAALDTRIARKP